MPPVETSSLIPHPSSLAEDIPTEIVHIMQRIGEAINCDPYRWVTVLKWTAPLKGAASEFGWACLLHQALRFETWIVGEHQSGKLKHGARANPLARFLNIWMRGNFPDGRPHVPLSERTAPDTVTDWPPELLPSHSPHFQINIERE